MRCTRAPHQNRPAYASPAQADCDEVVLETEVTNLGALRLYEGLGFTRDKLLAKYYLNGVLSAMLASLARHSSSHRDAFHARLAPRR